MPRSSYPSWEDSMRAGPSPPPEPFRGGRVERDAHGRYLITLYLAAGPHTRVFEREEALDMADAIRRLDARAGDLT